MNHSSSFLSLGFILGSFTCFSLFADTLPNDETSVEPSPETVVLEPLGTINKEWVESEPALPLLSELPLRPTRQELENIRIEGLVVVAVTGEVSRDGKDEEILAATLKKYLARENSDDVTILETYVLENPTSPWAPGLKVTIGKQFYYQGRFSEALECFEQAWSALKDSKTPMVRESSVTAAAELAGLYARLGRMDELSAVLKEVEGRPVSGPNTEKIRMAAEGLDSMITMPEHSFKCGPYALLNIRKALDLQPAHHSCIDKKESTSKGISLAELQSMAGDMDMDWVAAEREPGAELPLPVLVHWKLGHYAVVLEKTDDGRLLVSDPTFIHDFLITPEVLAQESSGRFLVPRKVIGEGWNLMSDEEAAMVLGKGAPTSKDQDDATDCPTKCSGMAVYDFDLFKSGLIIRDTPLWYNPPYGQAIEFNLTYRQRGEQVLDSAAYSFGPKWTSNWSSYAQQADGAGNVVVFLPGGGRETHYLNPGTAQFNRQKRSLGLLVKTSSPTPSAPSLPVIYELQNTDGSKLVFSQSVGTGTYRKIFLTSMVDAQGNTITLGYDGQNRLKTVKDALNQVSEFDYGLSTPFDRLVTKISDPFIPSGGIRRSAHFSYDSTGRLIKITDAEGIESSFTYDPVQLDFVTSMTTPYGTTNFITNLATAGDIHFVEVTDPLGRKERIEYRHTFESSDSFTNGLIESEPDHMRPDPELIRIINAYLYYGSTLHWDKKTYASNPPNPVTGANYDKAIQYKWICHPTEERQTIGVLSSIKKPFESRIWYEYPSQRFGYSGHQIGDTELPSKIGRLIKSPNPPEDPETQVDQYVYDDLGNITQHTDAIGRITKWQYDPSGMDLLNVKQRNNGNDETLQTLTYNPADPPRRPRTVTDASGQTTTYSWNTRGQLTGISQPGGLITTLNYSTSGYLNSVDGPLAGTSDVTSYTYDLYGRIRTTTSPGSYTLTYDYDALDRQTQVTYPDGTNKQFFYQQNGTDILDLTAYKDRENRWTLFGYNALRERTWMTDPLDRTTAFGWCYCGALQELTDAEGNLTQWSYDIGGRLTGKTYADGKQETHTYDLAGRLLSTTDAKGQVKTLSYYNDDRIAGIAYTHSTHPTANVSFSYDSGYGRLSQMTDGSGVTSYTYHPVNGSTLGGGNLHTVDGPLTNDTITYTYDNLGRLKTHSINGSANTTTVNHYDSLGRVTQLTNSLGAFTHTYDPINLQPKAITAPNGLTTEFSYHPNLGDFRLKGMKHQIPGSVPFSSHAYDYSPEGNIRSWAQAIGSNLPSNWDLTYDDADQLEAATLTNPSAAVIQQNAWRYDEIGNRTSRQNNGIITTSTHNSRNQIESELAGGRMLVAGSTDKPSNVKIRSNDNPFIQATTTEDNKFSASVETVPGSNTLTIEAKDTGPNKNTSTRSYTINVTGTSRIPSYDLNGNTINNGSGQTYQWDAENRLIKITYADNTSTEFAYDGFSRRVRITERNTLNVVTSDKRYVWAGGNQPAEERDASGSTVLKQYHSQGEFIPAAIESLKKLYYTHDHLGSVRELVDSAGNLQARYDYDMWGNRKKLWGDLDSDVGYTGHHHHAKSGLVLTWYRAYDPEAGRWLSPDPIGEAGGINLYGYVAANPINAIDPLGLQSCPWPTPPNNIPGAPWKWSPDPQNTRGGTLRPANPTPGKATPTLTWSEPTRNLANGNPEGYWKYNDGQKNTQRYDPKGTPITPAQAHPGRPGNPVSKPCPTNSPTSPKLPWWKRILKGPGILMPPRFLIDPMYEYRNRSADSLTV